MKKEFDDNLMEQPAMDDLGIRAAMEGVEPDEAARDRMLQNIMKKAAAAGASKEASSETPKAEVLSLKNRPKKTKSRWKQYLPMLIAAGVIVTLGTVFFAFYGMGTLGRNNSASQRTDARDPRAEQENTPLWDGYDSNDPSFASAEDPHMENELPHADEKHPDGILDPAENDAPESHPTDAPQNATRGEMHENPTQAANPDHSPSITGLVDTSDNDLISGDDWYYSSFENAYFKKFSYGGHDYELTVMVDGEWEVDYECVDRRLVRSKASAKLEKITFSEDSFGWLGEWSLNGSDNYYLQNADNAPEEEVWSILLQLKENKGDSDALK